MKEASWRNRSSKLSCQSWPTSDSYAGILCIFTCLAITSERHCFSASERKRCGLQCLVTHSLFWKIPRS